MWTSGAPENSKGCPHSSIALMVAAPSILAHRPWEDRRQLRRLGAYQRAVVESSGVMEWSDRELARLSPSWIKAFLRRHVVRCAFLALLYLLGLAFLGASFERYWHWLQSVEAVAGEPIRTVDRWTAYCRVRPLTRACHPAPRARSREVIPVDASSVGATAAPGAARLKDSRVQSSMLMSELRPSQ